MVRLSDMDEQYVKVLRGLWPGMLVPGRKG
jgi:hypothetical protein